MKKYLIIPILCLALCSCTAEVEQAEETTAVIPYETITAPEAIESEETIPEVLNSDSIVAEEETVLNGKKKVALIWAEGALSEWYKSETGRNMCNGNLPEITAISAEGKIQATCDNKTLCFESDENNELKFVGYNEKYIDESENMLEVLE